MINFLLLVIGVIQLLLTLTDRLPVGHAFLDERINESILGLDYNLNFELNKELRGALKRYLEEVPVTKSSNIIMDQIIERFSTKGSRDQEYSDSRDLDADIVRVVHIIGESLVVKPEYCDCPRCPEIEEPCTKCPIPCISVCAKCPLPDSCPSTVVESSDASCPEQPQCSPCRNFIMNRLSSVLDANQELLSNVIIDRNPQKSMKQTHELEVDPKWEQEHHPVGLNDTTNYSDQDLALFNKNVHTVIPDTHLRDSISALVASILPMTGGNQERMANYLLEQFRGVTSLKDDTLVDKFTRNTSRNNFKKVLGYFLERWRRRNCKCSECGTFKRCQICQLEEECPQDKCQFCEPVKYCPVPAHCAPVTPCAECI